MSKSRNIILLLILILIFIGYSPALKAGFNSLDDQFSIVNNERLRDVDNIGEVFYSSFFNDTHFYRPMVEASFLLEYQAFQLSPWLYRLDNIIIHAINTLLVFLVISMILKSQGAALISAALFGLHPIQSEPIVNIAGRSILLSSFFGLLSFAGFLYLRQKRYKFLIFLLSLLLFLCALLSKESAGMLPFIFLAYGLTVGIKRGERPIVAFASCLPYFIVLISFMIFRQFLGVTGLYHWETAQEAVLGFISFLRGVITYLKLYLFPVGLYFDRSQEIYTSFTNPQAIFTLLIWGLSVIGFLRWRKELSPEGLFFLLWFAFELFPVSQIVTQIGTSPGYISIAEHFVYLASVGIFSMAAIGLQQLFLYVKEKNTKIVQIGVLSFFIFLFLITLEQSTYAGNIRAMYERSVKMNPYNARTTFNLGLELAKEKRFEEAEDYFRRALHLDANQSRIFIALGKSLCDQGKYLECVDVYRTVNPTGKHAELLNENKKLSYEIILKAAQEYEKKGNMDKAIMYYEKYLMSGSNKIPDVIRRLERLKQGKN